MNLRKWKTNSIELSQKWEESKFENLTHNEAVPIKVLGLILNTLTDEFKLDLSSLIDSLKQVKNTKRSVLRISSKLFDPIGYIAVFTIRIKIILQEIWEGGFDWDEKLGKN
ncbi:uncharacterized protein TNIN_477231 [Trichonephila inaurata madagascariensis]|uniref:Uncharacterized protein n=1 Tax=Trichonephila inaurata madagascariensis TaxID=2747483 RepID=A0A8X6I8G8_9ARAC|nr:uncharacterized protein TNIN_477231 [Trichonephila inaurata madagascariensis]